MSLKTSIDIAQTFLFVPGNRPERYSKAVSSGADFIIIDLEDAVDDSEKSASRIYISQWLENNPDCNTVVRINAPSSSKYEFDCYSLRQLAKVIMVPKVESSVDIDRVRQDFGDEIIIIALIESAAGIINSFEIAAKGKPDRIAFGNIDFSANIGVKPDSVNALLLARTQLVLASTAAGISGPIDGVTTTISDEHQIIVDSQNARQLGYQAKLCIHPRQVRIVSEAFYPTEEEINWARTILKATSNGNATVINDEMIDMPVISRAKQILSHISLHGEKNDSI